MSTISQRSMGYRVSSAREASGMTQEALAKSLGLKDRQSVSDIETGKRSLKPEELMILAELFNRDIEFFIDPFVVAGEAQFSWRVDPAVTQASLDDFEDKAGQWIGLMRWMRELTEMPSDGGLKLSLQLTKNSTYEIAQDRAEAFVSKFELGQAPAERLIETVERDLDIPVLFVDTIEAGAGKSISGAIPFWCIARIRSAANTKLPFRTAMTSRRSMLRAAISTARASRRWVIAWAEKMTSTCFSGMGPRIAIEFP